MTATPPVLHTPADIRPLTALRFLAAAWVVVYAFWPDLDVGVLPHAVAKGYLGVEVFFVLSGFILCHVYLEAFGTKRSDYGGFLWARLARVYPLHLFTLFGVIALGLAATVAGMSLNANMLDWASLPANLAMVHAWGLSPEAAFNHPSWSISAEWFAYLLFPAYALIAMKLKTRPWVLLFLGVLGFAVIDAVYGQMFGKVLPRAAEIAGRITWIYLALTILNVLAYLLVGMTPFDAINHAFTTMSTGGFSTHDASFGVYQGAPEYVAAVFMILASLPFVRYIQLVAGTAQPLFRDSQIRAYLGTILVITLVMTIYRLVANGDHFEHGFREGVFNVTSIMSGTGYASVDYQLWGTFPIVAFFFLGLIGGCAGSTACSVKIFRYQILIAAIRARIMQILAPHGVFTPRFEGRPISEAVLSSVMAFFVMFVVSLGILAVLLSMTGLDMVTSLSGAATAIANIGPGLGDTIGPSGNFATLNDTAKWLLTAAMLVGRLELLSVYVLFTMRFWRG